MKEHIQKSQILLERSEIFSYLCGEKQFTKTMSPVFHRESSYCFKIFSNEEIRMHIHVLRDDLEAKFWIEPRVELAENFGFKDYELRRIQKIIEKHAAHFQEQYRQHIGKRIDD